MSKLSKTPVAKNIDEYLAMVRDDESRAVLEKLRRTIKSVVPDAVETISYQIPTFKYQGRMLVSFAAFSEHCSFFPGAGPIETYQADLRTFTTSKGTIRFTPQRPLPAALVKRLVKTRIERNEDATKKREGKSSAKRRKR